MWRADTAADPRRGSVRLTALVAAGLLALAAAGCGGGDELAPEVPGAPADVVIPESADAPTSAASQDDAAAGDTGDATTDDAGTTDDTTTAPDEAAPATGDTGTTTTPDASGGGTAAPETQADGPTNDTPPPEGSNAEQFEDFCAQNPGAC
jgi:hypothetical protein